MSCAHPAKLPWPSSAARVTQRDGQAQLNFARLSHSLILHRLPAPFVAHDIEHPFHPRLFLVDPLDHIDGQDDDTSDSSSAKAADETRLGKRDNETRREAFENGLQQPLNRISRIKGLPLSRSPALIIVQRSRQYALIDSSAATGCTLCMPPPPSPMESICHICDGIEKGRDALTGTAALALSLTSNLVGGSACGPPWLASDTAVDALC